MPQPAVIVVLACAGLAAWPARADVFPYSATVRQGVSVRGGPGETYYATARLDAGADVEVHDEHPGGWLAIRPPQGSYSWVAARYLRPTKDDLAVISGRGVVARIGGERPGDRDVWQVELDYNEPVQILGADDQDLDAAGKPRWYKIAPPAGEFRFVPASAVERKVDAAERASAAARVASSSSQPVATIATAGSARAARIDSPQLRRELDDISFALSRRVSRPASQWVLDDLREQTVEAESLARSADEKQAVRDLQTRIEGFAALGESQASNWKARTKPEPAPLVSRGAAAARGAALEASPKLKGSGKTTDAARQPPAAVADGRHDGFGRLVPMTIRNPGDPQYMLVDENDLPLYFVSPAPGVNLRPFQGRIVGVVGNSAQQGNLNRRHIMAQRIEEAPGSQLR